MNKKEVVSYLKRRWEVIHKIEVKELRKTSLEDRFNQTLLMFDLGKDLNLYTERTDSETRAIITRWRRLKDYYNGPR